MELRGASKFIIAPNDGIKLSPSSCISQIARIFSQCLVVLFRVLIGDPNTTSHLLNYLEQIIVVDAVLSQNLSGVSGFVFNKCEQQVFSRDELVLHFVGLFLCSCKNLGGTGAEILLTAFDAWKTSHRRLRIV